jgi:hypothetical protein
VELNEYKPIPGYESYYAINQNGTVISLYAKHYKKEIVKKTDRAGYSTVKLSKQGKDSTQYIHRLIAMTYIPNPTNKPMVNHINGNKLDNRVANLEWVSHSENMSHAYRTGLIDCCACGKRVIDECTGIEYNTILEAAKAVQIPYSTMKNYLNGNRTNNTCFKIAA